MMLVHPAFTPLEPRWTIHIEARQAAMRKRERRCGSDRGDVCRWKPRLFWSENNVSMRKRCESKRHAASAAALVLTTYRGAFQPLAHPQRSISGPYASRVHHTSEHATRVPGLRPAPTVS